MHDKEGLAIAEEFISIQGEGTYTGTPMYFIRLAGCNVGRSAKALKINEPFPVLSTGREASVCSLWDGRTFPCDTDYSLSYHKTYDDVCRSISDSHLRHVCVTGGEPLMHHAKLIRLMLELHNLPVLVHIETSGTIYHELQHAFITVSPKLTCLEMMVNRADELKLLVNEDFDEDKLTPAMRIHPCIYVQPVNYVNKLNEQNVERCYQLVLKHPTWRVSFQIHKPYNWR